MPKRILVIDDEEAIRKSFLLALEDTGYQIETAVSGSEGVQKAAAHKPDLIFLDLKMPGLNGVETLREIRRIYHDVPIYIVTAFFREFLDLLDAAIRDGIRFEVVNKPIGADQILKVAKAVFEGPVKA